MTTRDGRGTKIGKVTSRSAGPMKSSTSVLGSGSKPKDRIDAESVLRSMRQQIDESRLRYMATHITRFLVSYETLSELARREEYLISADEKRPGMVFGVNIEANRDVPDGIAIADYNPIGGGSILREDLFEKFKDYATRAFPGSTSITADKTTVTDDVFAGTATTSGIKFEDVEPIGSVEEYVKMPDGSVSVKYKLSTDYKLAPFTGTFSSGTLDASVFGDISKSFIVGTRVTPAPAQAKTKQPKPIADRPVNPNSIYGRALAKYRKDAP